jgi:Flp pilus assembly protein TadG
MIAQFRRLLRDERGANLVEFAIALPVLVLIIYGTFTVGMVLQASAGMQHALGEAARMAAVFPTPSDTAIQAEITAEKFGLENGTFGTPQIQTDTTAKTKTITLTYSQPTDFLFFQGPTVTLTRSKVVYLSS